MLNIIFGDVPQEMSEDYIYNTSVYFDNVYKDEWITNPIVKDIIRSVDKSEVIDEKSIKSPVFDIMSPKRLSGGTKTLILLLFVKNKYFNVSTCGDNCAEWILKIADNRKLVINLRHLMDFGDIDFKIRVMNTNKIVHSMSELVMEAGEFV